MYGSDLAKVDLLATREDVHGQGHARALVSGLEGTLSELGVRVLVVVLERSDREARCVCRGVFGWEQTSKAQLERDGEQGWIRRKKRWMNTL